MADAKALYEEAKDVNSLAEAQDAIRRSARISYYTLDLLGQMLGNKATPK